VTRPRIVIVGAGAAGLAMGMRLKRAGIDDFVIVDRSDAVGGTWHDNRYPGAGCDVPSHLYCFSFEPNARWSYKFARQGEIERYFVDCVERHGLAPHLRLGVEVRGAEFDDGTWRVATSAGELEAGVLVSGCGQLNRPRMPPLPGLERFAGATFHSARWDTSYDVTGRNVVVIGSGASAAQIVPEIAPRAARLTVMQRTPAYVIPRKDRAYRGFEQWMFRRVPGWRRLYRWWIYWSLEARFTALHRGSVMSKLLRWLSLRHLRAQVADPVLRAKLTPQYPVGCKRVVVSDDWYPALARPNVALVTAGIERVTSDAVWTADGGAHPADVIVFATGFESTAFLAPMRIVGRGGLVLADAWRDGAKAHRGVVVSGFPNLFLLYGPNTNLGHNSILFMIECQTRFALDCIEELHRRSARWLDVREEAMARWNARLQRDLGVMAWAGDCSNWYKTASGKITNNWSRRSSAYWWQTRKPDFAEFEISVDRATRSGPG
jgi:cation diffusion facilitator CzcD-associated flavoprotein CzcO